MSKKNNPAKKPCNNPRIATLHNMTNQSSDEEEEGQRFYAGGSERSGQQVVGPSKRKNFRDKLTDMFRMAETMGTAKRTSDSQPIPSTSNFENLYQGIGLRLGETENDHYVAVNDKPARPQNIESVKIKLWSQGFSINDSDLRLYDDDNNKEFLETMMRGQLPDELREIGSVVSVDLEDHRHEDFKKPTNKVKTFKGSGHTLGSPAPNSEEKPIAVIAPTSREANNDENEKKAKANLQLNPSKPTTMIQIRLPDGSRLSGRFNVDHTINDIRTYITTARPEYEFNTFTLVTLYPTKELSTGTQTVKEAGIINSSIMLRIM